MSVLPRLPKPIFKRLAIIGCGLIGSSVAHAARASGAAGEIVIHDASPEARARIVELGLADRVEADAQAAVHDADLVLLATPPAALGPAAQAVAPALKPGAVLTDVGSVKGAVAAAMIAA